MPFEDKIKRIIRDLDNVVKIAQGESAALIYGEGQVRVFNQGLDKNEQQIGQYDDTKFQTFLTGKTKLNKRQRKAAENVEDRGMTYKELRQLKGLQTAFVDLTFSTSLQKSQVVQKNKVIFKNDYGKKISKYNETHFGKRIFAPSKDERKIWFTVLNREIKKLIA